MDFKYENDNLVERSGDDNGLGDLCKDSPPHLWLSSSYWIWQIRIALKVRSACYNLSLDMIVSIFKICSPYRSSNHRYDGQKIHNDIGRRLQSDSRSMASNTTNGGILFSMCHGYCQRNIRSKYVDMKILIWRISQAGLYASFHIMTPRRHFE